MQKRVIYLPIVIALSIILGFFLGAKLNFSDNTQYPFPVSPHYTNKLNEVINYIEQEYVDSVNKEVIIEHCIQDVLQQLDPHSVYISAKDLQAFDEPLKGNFEGIGIEFSIQKDTIVVISPIIGGPSEVLGIMAGDRIIKVDSQIVAGIGISNQKVLGLLKGAKGTKVTVSILRRNKKDLIDFTIVRDKIPIYSVDVAYMVNDTTGYIRISRFAQTTYREFVEAGNKLLKQGMNKIILDLRGNGGGLLDVAIQLADEFLEDKKLIVYTEGKSHPRKSYLASKIGHFEKCKIIVLIDEGSASASEIIAGAIQDNDRGQIIGRRSFGKGLVQEHISLSDGAAIRLTIARYYTPTGRCIHKPYDKGTEDYHLRFLQRYENGELLHADSTYQSDSLKYSTPKGKVVYGGGGIMPDIFIPIDTVGHSKYLSEITSKGLIIEFAFNYADNKRDFLNKFPSIYEFDKQFAVDDKLFEDLISYAEKNGVKSNRKDIDLSKDIIEVRLKASIARNIWNDEGFYPIIQHYDNVLKKAIEL